MLNKLGNLIEKKPKVVILLIVLITIGFSLLLPSLEFKTDFSEFLPDDELSLANTRIQEYFGINQMPLFLLVEKDRTSSAITPEALREIDFLERELQKQPKVSGTIAITTFLNPVCLIEFGKTVENCTDEELGIALHDILQDAQTGEIQLFASDDPNEPIDYQRYPRFSQGKSVESADIKNCYLSKDNESITFSIETYGLDSLDSEIKPTLTKINVMEWYLGFENLIQPTDELDISYRIAAHIEPVHPLWS